MARIAVVEDELDLAELYGMVLGAAGHEILGIYGDPRVLIEEEKGSRLDVILLDERLSVCMGSDYLKELLAAFPRARILVATADPDAFEEALRRGAHAAKKKPFPLAELVGEVERLAQAR